jgi:hypothetical protein
MAQSRFPTVLTGFPAVAKAITPSDAEPLRDYNGNQRGQTIYVGTGGSVSVVPIGNDIAQPVTFVVPDGGLVPVECMYVRSTGTDATNLVGLF